jgi:hypothetical protein
MRARVAAVRPVDARQVAHSDHSLWLSPFWLSFADLRDGRFDRDPEPGVGPLGRAIHSNAGRHPTELDYLINST